MVKMLDAYVMKISRALLPIQTPTLKLGGVPVLLQELEWPTCKECGQRMDFLAQLPLTTPIPFLNQDAMAYVFMCSSASEQGEVLGCATWEPFGGANAVAIQYGTGKTIIPTTAKTPQPEFGVTLSPVKEPQIDTADFWVNDELTAEVSEASKMGGVPAWIQSNETPRCPVCNKMMQFVAQLDAELEGSLPADPARWGDYHFLNFGDAGIGYLFVCQEEGTAHSAAFFWQCS